MDTDLENTDSQGHTDAEADSGLSVADHLTSTGAVVVAVDGSEHAEDALAWAADHAALHHRPLAVVSVWEPVPSMWLDTTGINHTVLYAELASAGADRVKVAAEKARSLHPELSIETAVGRGDVRGELLRLSKRASLLVLGSRGRGPIRSLLLGSVSAAVARHALGPVVVVRPGGAGGGGVLVGIDGTERSMGAVTAAYEQAAATGQHLTVLHCFWDARVAYAGAMVVDESDDAADVRALVAETTAGLAEKHPDVDVEVRIVRGLADQVLVAESQGRDLVVLGYHRQHALGEALFPSVVTSVLEHAHGAVMVVPARD
ncbi:universal stress protein [Nocardioides cremeus]|jgi:nucleotide-binding universal stress UspA family protein|uniref:Universal stress protein n=1 Tax=Nocardioides cremeus TaxID=3058044 RepID=A0ABT8TVE1_9ACTN|nr:universal stress protein [Nocardioides cremeus]MDO3397926.1 universal stress protein [Nocardioides cremeus]